MASITKRMGAAMAAAAAAATGGNAATANEGMWTVDNFPTARVREEFGWAPDQAWLDHVRAGAVRLESGCSGAIVSAEGLIQTNHHCVLECVADFSTPGRDMTLTGLQARSRAEERRCPGMAAQVLLSISDVTERMEEATQGAGARDFTRARDAEVARIESECSNAAPERKCQVVTLYQGGQYKLHTYKRYEDLRLVFTPEVAAAFFGGDPDNFNFPRYCFDVAYLRLYEHDRPAATPDRFHLRTTPLADGDLVFVAGNPGATSRQLTTAQLAFQRDHFLPWRLAYLSELRGRLLDYSGRGAEEARIAADGLLDVENAFKAYWGRRLALADERSFAAVARAEAQLQARVRRGRAVAGDAQGIDAASAWDEAAAATNVYRGLYLPHQLVEARAGAGSELFYWARHLVRAAAERQKPNPERLRAYGEARLPSLQSEILADTPIEPQLETLLLSFWLSKTREYLTVDDPLVRRILGRESPEGLAQRLVSGTRLADPAERRRLWEGGAAAIAASTDPLIVFVRAWDDDARAVLRRYEQDVEGPIARAQERIASARFQSYGESLYPDATFTLRVSYGRVAGWTEPTGRQVAPFTLFGGLRERATGHAPFALAQSWAAAQARLGPGVIFNVSSTNDIIGGNSGSPLIDREGRVAGAVFDGNIHSLGGEYFYDEALNRTVSVASTAILEALATVYRMNDLVAELRR
jgi:hypothetical protein